MSRAPEHLKFDFVGASIFLELDQSCSSLFAKQREACLAGVLGSTRPPGIPLNLSSRRCSDDYLRGYLQGLRRHHREGQSGTHDEYAQWPGFADRPALPDLERGYRDGLAGIEPQPKAASLRRTSFGTRWSFKAG